MFFKFFSPLVWHPKGVIASLGELLAPGNVVAKYDVTPAVSGENAERHPLIVAELAGGKIIGDLRLVATADDVVIGGVQTIFGAEDLTSHYALQRRRFRIPQYRGGTALLLGTANSDNYYHWLLESLPRWKMLQSAGYQNFDYVLLHSQPSRFQDEMLDRLGVPVEKRLRCSKNVVHQFDRLVVPTMPAPLWSVDHWACRWLRSLFPELADGPKRIYVSRRNQRRPLVNETALEAQLSQLGFAIVLPESLTVLQQAKLFGAAEFVVGAHGAGLTNLVFAPPGGRLLELFHPQYRRTCYANLAAACGHQYQSLEGEGCGSASDRNLACRIDVGAVIKAIAGGK